MQRFAEGEDIAFEQMIANYERATGNTIDDSIVPFVAMRQKWVAIGIFCPPPEPKEMHVRGTILTVKRKASLCRMAQARAMAAQSVLY